MAIESKSSPKAGSLSSGDSAGQRTRNYVNETLTELKKTTWPTKQEATRLTIVVVAVIIGLGLYMGMLDWVLSWLVNKFSLIK
jgi:preprotein translocase SecE subunit